MNTTKEVRVVINGEEHVSAAAQKASGGMDGFMGKAKGWAAGLAVITAAWYAVSAVVGKVADVVMESFDAFDQYAASQNKMAAQSKLTGVPLEELRRTAKAAREEFGLGTTVANDAATTVSKYASRAGDATQSNKLLAAALDLGAASGLTAAESMDALEQGLRGQDEGFDKLLGKNPSTLWKEYADANGLAVGKMTDTEKRMAELTAVVEAGNIVQGSYNDRAQSGAGAQEKLNNKLDEAKATFGQALQPLRIFIVQGLTNLVEVGGRVVLGIARVANAIGVIFVGAIELGRSVVGGLSVAIGKLTGNKELEAWGKTQANAFGDFQVQLAKLEKKYLDTGAAAEESANQQEGAGKKVRNTAKLTAEEIAAAAKKEEKAWQEKYDKLKKTLEDSAKFTEAAHKVMLASLDKLDKSASKALDTHKLTQWNDASATFRAAGDAAFNGIRVSVEGTLPPLDDFWDRIKKSTTDLASVARGAIDAAGAFGILDRETQTALTSVVNVGTSIGKLAGGDLAGGLAGILGGVANIVSTIIGGDMERRRLLKENSQQLERLRNEVGNLSLNVTGNDFEKATAALSAIVPKLLPRLIVNGVDASKGGNLLLVSSALAKAGLSMEKFESIAKELGIQIRDKDGKLVFERFKDLLEGLGLTEFGKFGTDFTSQKQATEAGFDVNKLDAVGQIKALTNLGGTFSDALKGAFDPADIAGSRARLTGLFNRLNAGGVSASELGELTGSQFLDLLTDIIGRIDALKPEEATAPAATGSGAPSSSAPGDETVYVPGVGDVPSSAAGDVTRVIRDQQLQMVSVLDVHTGLHTRVALATEGSWEELRAIRGYLEQVDVAGSVDLSLETTRAALAAQRGVGVSY